MLSDESSRFCSVEGTVVQGNTHDQYDVGDQTDIAITHSIQLNEAVSNLTADVRLAGTFHWSALRDRSGTCTVDVQVLLNITGGQALQTLRGDFCDRRSDDTGTWVPLYGG